jgi:hypothetical protein
MIQRNILISLILLVCTLSLFGQTFSKSKELDQKRVALVIGNGNYLNSILANPENDARAIKSILEQLGFVVLEYENLNQTQLKKAIDEFGTKLKGYDVGLFFYAGHGIQAKGINYLVPVDANLTSEAQVEYDCVQAERVLALMEESGAKVKIVILDACRNNPFERSWTRGVSGRGLAQMMAPSGTLIAYSTGPNKTASDGSGNNSIYTTALLQNIAQENISIMQMFQNTRFTVAQKSANEQIPWESTSLIGDFYFNPSGIFADSILGQNQIINKNLSEDKLSKTVLAKLPSKSIRVLNIQKEPNTSYFRNLPFQRDTLLYAKLNHGANIKIRPKNYLNVFGYSIVKSTITKEELVSKAKKVGYIVVKESFLNGSNGRIRFNNFYNQSNQNNANLLYAKKKVIWNSLYAISRVSVKNGPQRSSEPVFGVGYMFNGPIGAYLEISQGKILEDRVERYFFSAGISKSINPIFSLRAGGTYDELGGSLDVGLFTRLRNNISILTGMTGFVTNSTTYLTLGLGFCL